MRGGNKVLKRVFYQSAFASLRSAPKSRAFYDRKRAEGKRHTQALIALARRRVNVLWAMLRDGTTFETRSVDLWLDIFIEILLYPASQSVEAANLRHIRGGEIAICTTPFGLRSRQVGEQVNGGELRQRGGVGGGDHQPPVPSCFKRPASGFQCPPRLYVSIAEGVLQSDPLSRIVLSLPRVLSDNLL